MNILTLVIKISDDMADRIKETNKIVYEDGAIKLGKHEVKIEDILYSTIDNISKEEIKEWKKPT